jgi:DNA (cytosine-5)-methyltransferase 1
VIKCLEFFAGIGAFAAASHKVAMADIVCAFDQNPWANLTYRHNFAHKVDNRAIESLTSKDLLALGKIDLWWMSPPCQPYSRRGKQADLEDSRAVSLLRLVALAREIKPRCIMIENVLGFKTSRALAHIKAGLGEWYHFAEIEMCSSTWVPMKRPRYFVIALARDIEPLTESACFKPLSKKPALIAFIEPGSDQDASLQVPPGVIEQYQRVLNIIRPQDPDSYAICFTSNYQSCRTAGGSIISHPGGHRFFSPREMLSLFGFPIEYDFPEQISLANRYRLIGNSMDVRQVAHLLSLVSSRLAK